MLLSLLGEHAVAGVVLQKCTNIFFLISFLLFIFFCRYLLKVGDHNLSKKEKSEQLMDLEKIYVHANYIHSKIVNDIALVKLKAGVKLGKFVRTVCLPPKTRRRCGSSFEIWHSSWMGINKGLEAWRET